MRAILGHAASFAAYVVLALILLASLPQFRVALGKLSTADAAWIFGCFGVCDVIGTRIRRVVTERAS